MACHIIKLTAIDEDSWLHLVVILTNAFPFQHPSTYTVVSDNLNKKYILHKFALKRNKEIYFIPFCGLSTCFTNLSEDR